MQTWKMETTSNEENAPTEVDISLDEVLVGLSNVKGNDQKLMMLELLANVLAQEANLEMSEAQAQHLFVAVLTAFKVAKTTEKRPALRNKLMETCLIVLSNATMTAVQAERFYAAAGIANSTADFHSYMEEYLSHNPHLEMDGQDAEEEDEWRYLGQVITNLCQLEPFRKLLLQASSDNMERLALQIRSKSIIRRRSAVAAVRRYPSPPPLSVPAPSALC